MFKHPILYAACVYSVCVVIVYCIPTIVIYILQVSFDFLSLYVNFTSPTLYSVLECTPSVVPPPQDDHPCNPTPCGSNALCTERNGAGSCACMPNYFGDPYSGCRPECIQNSDCPYDKSCLNTRCVNPCAGSCAPNAECRVRHHQPECTCPSGYSGNAMIRCQVVQETPYPTEPTNPCLPSPCGPFSNCRVQNERPVCSCLPDYISQPPYCRPECVSSSDCARDKSCVNAKCINPCAGTCGFNAECRVINHNPICSCSPRHTGNPFVECQPERNGKRFLQQKTNKVSPTFN